MSMENIFYIDAIVNQPYYDTDDNCLTEEEAKELETFSRHLFQEADKEFNKFLELKGYEYKMGYVLKK